MMQAVFKCLRKYAKFNGRASRSEFWWFTLLTLLFEWPLLLTYGGDRVTRLLGLFYFTLTLLVLLPHAAVWTRRMHDVGKRGWSWLFIFIPIIGWFLIIRRLTKPGDPNPNKFGDPDNGPKTTSNIRTRLSAESLKAELNESESVDTDSLLDDSEDVQGNTQTRETQREAV